MSSISVVIPVRNDAEMLARCLDALARQSRVPDEIVVVDNGSTDATAAVAAAGHARVVVEPRLGIFPATATGFDAARGEVLARLDADSVAPPDWVARVEAAFDADPSLTALTGPGDFYGGNRLTHFAGRFLYIGGYFWFMGLVLGHPPLFGSNLALRASAWQRLRRTVHRDLSEVHDDLDLSYHIEPDMDVVLDRSLRVGISARPFDTWPTLRRRLVLAYATIRLNGREIPTAHRRSARRRFARERARQRALR